MLPFSLMQKIFKIFYSFLHIDLVLQKSKKNEKPSDINDHLLRLRSIGGNQE